MRQELEQVQCLAGQTPGGDAIQLASTLEMERLEALSGAVESLWHGRQQSGAVRLLEHLASAGDHLKPCELRPYALIQ